MTEKGTGEFKQLEIILKVENDVGEILTEYLWLLNPERTKEVLEEEEEMKMELSCATKEALAYIQRDKSMVENAVIEEKELDLEKVLTSKLKEGLTKKGIEDFENKDKDKITEEPKNV